MSRDIETQTIQMLDNLKAVLEAAGAAMSSVVKTTVFIKDMNDFPRINEIHAKYFSAEPPTKSCVEVSRLSKDVLIEIEAMVTLRS